MLWAKSYSQHLQRLALLNAATQGRDRVPSPTKDKINRG